jgi:phosphoglucosamine mutase
MPVHFGTDGIRGLVPDEINVKLAYRLGRAVAEVFVAPIYVGYDTRESSPELAQAVLAGLADGGASGVNLGIFTTPGVAVIAQQRSGAGIVVSASHNPYHDNGLKVLNLGGGKLDRATEEGVENALSNTDAPTTLDFLHAPIDESAQHDYAHHLRELVPNDLTGLHIVLDCANGAASYVAHELFEATGARITAINDQPDGKNINLNCGSTKPAGLSAKVLELRADLGLAFDGDADRLIAVDAQGVVRDGDDIMILLTLDRINSGTLGGGLAVTQMSNLGLHRAMREARVEVIETEVGDRNVLLALEERAWNLGGEQSGHIIFRELAPTGDGLLTGLLVADLVKRNGPLAAQADRAWLRVPQALINIANADYNNAQVESIFNRLSEEFAVDPADVRLLIRPSGTEPVVRVMIEALNAEFVTTFTQELHALFGDSSKS